MDKKYETAILRRETTAASSFIRGIDAVEGDLVQIKGPGRNAGRIGRVIGVSYQKRQDNLVITVMFSDEESYKFSGDRLILLRRMDRESR